MRHVTVTFVVLLLSVTADAWTFGPDGNVCSQAEYAQTAKVRPPQTMPKLPKQWSVRIEVDMFDLGYSLDVHEYYDEINNRGAVSQWKEGMETRMIYLYSTNELIVLQYDGSGSPPTCQIKDIANGTSRDYFGIRQYANGSEYIYRPDKALHFEGSGPEVPMGRVEGPDGTEVDAWESCAYMEEIDATLVVDWLFSANSDWISPENMVIPVQRSAQGVMHVNQSYFQKIDRRYLYTDFRLLDNDPEPFQTPPGTYCKNRFSLRSLPNVTKMFSFSTETILPQKKHVSQMTEYYDYDLKLIRYDYTPDPDTWSKYGHNKLIRVHDFNSGVAYVIDSVRGNCTVTKISDLGSDAKSIDSGKVRMRTNQEFLHFDKVKYEYAGQRVVRGVNADVFIALRHDYPPGYDSPQTTWEWYFATKEWKESVGAKFNSDVPVRLHVTGNNPAMDVIYNIYDYSEVRPDVWKTDVSSCYSIDQKHDFKITFPATNVDAVTSDINGFKLEFLRTMVAVTNVSPIRVTGIEVEFPVGSINVIGTLLDKPPITGDTSTENPMVSLAAAVTSLNDAVQQKHFAVALLDASVVLTASSIG